MAAMMTIDAVILPDVYHHNHIGKEDALLIRQGSLYHVLDALSHDQATLPMLEVSFSSLKVPFPMVQVPLLMLKTSITMYEVSFAYVKVKNIKRGQREHPEEKKRLHNTRTKPNLV